MNEIKPKFCPNCGKGTSKSATFCMNCGHQLMAKEVHRSEDSVDTQQEFDELTEAIALEQLTNNSRQNTKNTFNTRKALLIWTTSISLILTLLFLGSSDGEQGSVGSNIFAGIFLGCLIGSICTIVQKHIYFKKNPEIAQVADPSDSLSDEKLTGINGWLAFFSLGQLLTVFILGYGIYELLSLYGSVVGTEYSSIINFEILANCIYLGLVLWTLSLIYKRKQLAIKVVTLLLSFAVFITFVDGVWAGNIQPEQTAGTEQAKETTSSNDAGRSLWAALIWIPYMHKSRRVKLTLTN